MSRALHKLSARFVETASRPKRYSDGGGLYLAVTSKSSKRWVFMFRWRGKLTEMGLGSAVEGSSRYKTLAAVRQEAVELRGLLAANENPLEVVRASAAEQAAIPTFGEFADDYIALMKKGMRNAKHRAQWETALGSREIDLSKVKKDALGPTKEHIRALTALRAKPVDKVDSDDVLRLLKPIWLVKNETATRIRSRVENVLDAAKAANKRSGENPARWRGHLNKLLPATKALVRGHHKAMPYEDVAAFVAGLRKRHAMAARALEFTILTAARSNETLGMTWEEVDLHRRLWVVPKERMKAGKEHRVPLPERACEILRELEPFAATSKSLVFTGPKDGPLSNMAMPMVLKRAKAAVTVHGFRSSFRDWAGDETPFPTQVIEMALAHAIPNKAEAAYRRKDALEKRRRLMSAWSEYIGSGACTTELADAA
ncbi:MAG: tyrosine-type recombinase/integrase [Phreatobacter sp.]|nr:tyrosine-type recombinase/integrase [Phreatobacter sp.]